MAQLSEFLTPKQIEQLTEAVETVAYNGKGSVTIEFMNGHVINLSKTLSERFVFDKEPAEAKVVV